MKKTLLLFAFITSTALLTTAQTNKTFFLGHSLVNFNMPNMVNKLSIAGAKTFSYKANIGNGANLLYHWNNPTTGQGDQWNTTLPSGGFEHFIITEAVPLLGHLQWSATYQIADSLYRFANVYNPDIQYYIYETWHCTDSGNGSTAGIGGYPCDWDPQSTTPWRHRLTIDLPKWEGIADSVNSKHPKPMLVIPAGQALGRLSDSISAGVVPGLTSINDLFSDDIHLDLRGNYFIACVMYATIHKVSPEGLPNQLTDEWGSLYTLFPTTAQATILQKIAWETICAYPRDGVTCTPTSATDHLSVPDHFTLFPNPATDKITISSAAKINTVTIYNVLGENIYQSSVDNTTAAIDLRLQPKGIYFVKIDAGKSVFIKKIVLE